MSAPPSYSDQELEALLSGLESDLVERKESFRGSAPESVREAVCAFANDLPDYQRPGVVFIGARDDGSPAGIPVTDDLLLQLADIKTDGNIVPPPTLVVTRRVLKGAEMAVLTVMPSDSPPVRYRGRVWVRIGPRRGIATAQDERVLNEKRRSKDVPYDARPVPTAALSELSRVRFDAYLQAAIAPDVLAANERTYEQQLASAKMVASSERPTPTVLGLLVLAHRPRDFLPGAYIQFLRVSGLELGEPVQDELVVQGPVANVLERIDDKLVAHNRVQVDFTSGPVEKRTHQYPHVALQQLVRNAVMHRSYEGTHAPVRVYWFDDRIEITNPGGPFGAVTARNFGEPGVTDYRNPNLAEALRVLGFVQHFGAGIPTARRALATNGNPPLEFQVDQAFVRATVRQVA